MFHGEASSGAAMDVPAVGSPNTTMAMIASSVPGMPMAACSPAVAVARTSMPTPASAAL